MNPNHLPDGDVGQLARLFALDQAPRAPESEQRYGALLACQLRVQLAVDLPPMARSEAALRDLSRHLAQVPGETFGQLLSRPDPPLLLLNMVKAFAKSAMADADAALPRDVATVLYCAAIAASLVRHHHAPTRLNERELASGLAWSASRPWVGADLAALFAQAAQRLADNATKAPP